MARQRIPGVPSETEVALLGIIDKLQRRLDALERKPTSPALIEENFFAREGQFLRIAAPSAGIAGLLPKASPFNRGAEITLSFETANPVRLECVGGTVNGEDFVINTAIGTYKAISDGENGWNVALGVSSSGSAVDATYHLQTAHGSLPNARVATTSTEIEIDNTVANVVSWALRAASVVFAKLQNLTGLSVLGRAANSAGVMAAITATAGDRYLRSNTGGTALEFGNPASTSILNTSGTLQRAALTGFAAASQNSNATTSAEPIVTYSASANMSAERVTTSSTSVAVSTSVAGQIEFQRAALTGDVTASANSNATLLRLSVSTALIASGTVNDAPLGATINRLTCSLTGTVTLTGLSGGADGRILLIDNTDSADTLVLADQTGSSAANQIVCPGNTDFEVRPGESVLLWYAASRWHVINAERPGWADTLAISNNSGANNPHIDAGQYIGFGTEGSLPIIGDIRASGDFAIRATDSLDIRASDGPLSIRGGTADDVSITASSDLVMVCDTGEASVQAPGGLRIINDGGGESRITLEQRPDPGALAQSTELIIWADDTAPTRLMMTEDEQNDWAVGYAALNVLTSDQTVTNSTTNQTGVTFTIPANSSRVGTAYRCTLGYMFNHTAAPTPTLTAELVLAGGVVASAVMSPISTEANFYGEVVSTLTVRTVGASGTALCTLSFRSNHGTTITNAMSSSDASATDAIDTTVDNSLVLRIRMTTAVATNTLSVVMGIGERLA